VQLTSLIITQFSLAVLRKRRRDDTGFNDSGIVPSSTPRSSNSSEMEQSNLNPEIVLLLFDVRIHETLAQTHRFYNTYREIEGRRFENKAF